MKLAIGRTYKEAVMDKPMTGLRQDKPEDIQKVMNEYKVVLDYKLFKKARYYWKRHDKWHVYLYDTVADKPVWQDAATKKILYFTSIRNAQDWAYEHDKEFYDALINLSTM